MSESIPIEISNKQETVTIKWNNGHISKYNSGFLRQKCPCALCTEDPKRKPKELNPALMIMKVEQVGRYAIQFQFSDLHQIGIYPFGYLRSLCSCRECSKST